MGADSNLFTILLIRKCVKWCLKCKAKLTNTLCYKKMDTEWNFWVTKEIFICEGGKDRGKNIPLFFLQFRCCCFHIDQEKWQFSMIIIFLLVLYISPTAASRTLVEYEIQMEHLQISSENNISKAELKFVFRRRMEFHVGNTFLQVRMNTSTNLLHFLMNL